MTPDDVPPALVAVTQLGPVVAIHRERPLNRWPEIRLWLMITVAFSAIMAIAFFGESTLRQWGLESLAVGLMIASLGLFITPAYLFVILLKLFMDRVITSGKRALVVVRYRDGLATARGPKVEVWPYADIREIYATGTIAEPGAGVGGPRQYVLNDRDHRGLTLSAYVSGLDDLMDAVRRDVYERLGTELRGALGRGERVSFGPQVTLGRQDGIAIAGKSCRWDEVRGFGLKDGFFFVQGPGRAPVEVPATSVPNLDVVLQLLQESSVNP